MTAKSIFDLQFGWIVVQDFKNKRATSGEKLLLHPRKQKRRSAAWLAARLPPAADQRLCLHNIDSTIPLLSN